MVIVFGVFLLTLLFITAMAIVRATNLLVAVMLTSIFSFLMAANFFLLDAADVALTEAAVGAGITTVFFLCALGLTTDKERALTASHWWPLLVVIVTTMTLVYATFDKPRLGDPDAPVHQHVAPWYLEKTPEYIDIPNVVTAVLGSFRGYDTLGEVLVVFTAGIGVMLLLGQPGTASRPSNVPSPSPTTILRHHIVPRVVGRLLIPFIFLFGLYVQFHGEYGPGGGFQAGALIATAIILYSLLEGNESAMFAVPPKLIMFMMSAGVFLYAFVGMLGILSGGNFLDYSVLLSDPVKGQHIGIILIEAGVGITVCGSLLAIFHALASRGRA